MIKLSNVGRRFGDHVALSGWTVDLPDRGVLGVLGPNGAGKTTLFRLLTGFFSPTEGTITLDGTDTADEPELLKREVGSLSETPPLYPEMQVREFLRFAAGLRGRDSKRTREIADRAMEEVELQDRARQRCSELSRGYRQRVGIAAALIAEPRYLILDEPTVGLDPAQTERLRERIAAWGKERAVLFSSHVLTEVEATCERVLVLSRGQLIADSPTGSLAKSKDGRSALVLRLASPQDGWIAPLEKAMADAGRPVEIESADGESARLRLDTAHVPELARTLCAQGLPLMELRPATSRLEEAFRETLRGGGTRP